MHFLTSKLYQRVAHSFRCYQLFSLVDLGIKVKESSTKSILEMIGQSDFVMMDDMSGILR